MTDFSHFFLLLSVDFEMVNSRMLNGVPAIHSVIYEHNFKRNMHDDDCKIVSGFGYVYAFAEVFTYSIHRDDILHYC